MRSTILALAVLGTITNPLWSQRGIPIPRISVPRPVVPHIVPHVPHTGNASNSGDSWDVLWIILGSLAGIGVLVGGVLGVRALMRRAHPRMIRIVAAPPGEAPDEVRQEWIGVELPLAPDEPEPKMLPTFGVLSKLPTGVASGYLVLGAKAIEILASHSVTAAEWWRAAAPHVLAPGYKLSFPAEVCERLA